ncbi:hypothetical protein DOY81_010234 [Sarcophaga bullata]|nr:hypothetical protein DOY81_010234 [Sarcophaga bullata]
MKFLWLLLVVALSALLFIQTAKADDAQAVKEIQNPEKDDKIIENKLLNEVETKNDMTFEDEEQSSDDDDEEPTNSEVVLDNEDLNKEVQDSQPPELIEEKQVAAFENQPELHRLARNIKAFHNYNVLVRSKGQQLEDEYEDADEALAEERAIRKRQRVRRRKTKNKVKRTNRNKHVANTRRSAKRRSKNKNTVHRKTHAKKSKTNRRSQYNTKRRYAKRNGSLKRKTRKSTKRNRKYRNGGKRSFSTKSNVT